MKTHIMVFGLLLAIIVVMGCSGSPSPTEPSVIIISTTIAPVELEKESFLSKTPTAELNETIQPITTTNIKKTTQPAIGQSEPSETLTHTPFPTHDVVYSSLSEDTATQNLIELLEMNRGCELPCWWGIVPGETSVDSIESTFVPMGFDWYRDFEQLENNTIYKASTWITSENNIVQSIKILGGAGEKAYDQNEAWRPYAIPRILERLGLPEQVYVYYPFRFDPGGMQAYRMFLYYPELGVEIDYLGKASLNNERPGWARACPNILETDDINLFLFQPGKEPDYLELTMPESSLPLPKLEGDPYESVSWKQVTESSLEEFGRLFTESEEGTVCFEFKTYWTDN